MIVQACYRKCTVRLTSISKCDIKKEYFRYIFSTITAKKKNYQTIMQLIKNYLMSMARKPSNYGSVRISLLNFTADGDIKLFLELSFFFLFFSVKKKKN